MMLLPWTPCNTQNPPLDTAIMCQSITDSILQFTACVPSPLTDAFGCLQEASMVCLLEGLVGLSDEGGGPLDALLAAGYLLG